MSCVFCHRITDRDYEETGVEGVVRFEPLDPVTRGHMLFVPTQHCGNASDVPPITGRVFAAAALYGRQHRNEYNLITSAGPNATQSIFHLHVHYVPREMGDGLRLPWTGQVRGSHDVPARCEHGLTVPHHWTWPQGDGTEHRYSCPGPVAADSQEAGR